MPTDPHQGGDLSDMAATGTTMPNDAGKMNLIPSVPRPGEGLDDDTVNADGNSLAAAATNATDIPRSVKDTGYGADTEIETGTGGQLPAQVESKRLHESANNPLAKGHDRYDKHSRQKESDIERYAGEGPGMERAPGEEGLEDEQIDRIVDKRETKQT